MFKISHYEPKSEVYIAPLYILSNTGYTQNQTITIIRLTTEATHSYLIVVF